MHSSIPNGVYRPMDIIKDNADIIHQYFEEVWNQGKLDVVDRLIASDYINHNPGGDQVIAGPEGLKPIVATMRNAFTGLCYCIEQMVVTEDRVAVLVEMRGVHTGDFFGIPATGLAVDVKQMQIERIEHGKIAEHWRVTDDLRLLQQLGQV